MIVQRYTDSIKKSWNEFILQAKNATFLFDRNYMDYHANRFDDYSLVIFDKKKIIAIFPANLIGHTIISHQGLSYGGIITLPKVSLQNSALIYSSILEYLAKENIKTIQLKVLPSFYHLYPSDEVDYFMHVLDAKKTKCDVTLTINQNKKIGFNTNKKRNIKLAKKNKLTISSSDNYTDFWNNILIPNLKESHGLAPVHTAEEIMLLHSNFPKEIALYVVLHNQQIIGGTVLFITNNVVHAQYISANEQGKEFGALDYLFDFLINEKYCNKDTFDFGIVNQDEGINLGLTYWKEGFGARTYCHDFYEIKTVNSHLIKNIFP